MSDTTNDNSERDAEIAAIAKTLESRKAEFPTIAAYGIAQAAPELHALYRRQCKETGKDPDIHRLIRLAEEHLKDEAKRLSKAKPKPTEDKPEAKAKKPARPLTPQQRREALAKKFAASAQDKPSKPAAKKPTKPKTPEQRRREIASKVLRYREPPRETPKTKAS